MAAPSVTNTFTNGTTADATEVNQNFTDIINGITDGTKDLTISAFTAQGVATFNGAVTLGNATGDDITVTGYVASDIISKTNATYNLGSASLSWQAIYLDNDSTNGGTIYFDAGSTEFIRANAAGTDLLIDGFTTVTVDATLVPQTTQATDIGSTSLAWQALYLDNGATDGGAIYFNSGTTAFIKAREDVAALDIDGFTEVEIDGNLDLDGTLDVSGVATCSAEGIVISTADKGITFTNGGNETLDHYETFSTSFNFRKAGVAGSQATVTVTGIRVGDMVTIEVPGFTISQANPGGISSSAALASNFRPATSCFFIVSVTNQGTKQTGTMGHFLVNSSGTMTLYLDTANSTWSGGGSADGMNERYTFTYQVS